MATEWLRPRDAVARYRVCRSTLHTWAKRGWIGVSHAGAVVWYAANDIDELIATGCRPRTEIPVVTPTETARTDSDWENDDVWKSGAAAPTTATVLRPKEKASRG